MNTPYYLLEEDKLRRNLTLIRDVADRSGAEIILAFKAFALWKTFPIFREYINATTASSPDEARLAFEEFGAPAHTYSPAYTERDFPEILRCSSHITFNSLSQFYRFRLDSPSAFPVREGAECFEDCKSSQTTKGVKNDRDSSLTAKTPSPLGRAGGESCSFGLRVNPEYSEIETELYNPCAPGSRFGVLAADLPSPSDFPADIEGFHIHCHCESSAETFARTLEHIIDKFSPWFPRLKWINFGGGHLMTRKDYNVEFLIQTLRDFHARWPHLRMILEPGSAFAWQTGPLVASVVDIVENNGIRTAILDVSFTCHMPDCLEMPYYPQIKTHPLPPPCEGGEYIPVPHVDDIPAKDLTPLPTREGQGGGASYRLGQGGGSFPYRLGGNSCLSGDFMGTWLFPRPLVVGDEIVFEDMIHYTTVKTTVFNGIHHPSIVLRRLDGTLETLREYRYEDYRDRMD